MKLLSWTNLVLLLASCTCFGQTVRPESPAEGLAACGILQPEPRTNYGFAKATLVSLWYGKTAADRGNEIKQAAKETDNMFSFVTAMMRITKTSTNDFFCAKQSLRPFTTNAKDQNVRTAAELMMVIYDAHISINERIIGLLKQLDTVGQSEVMDKISTLQVERSQRWADIVQPTTIALMMMVDLNHTDVPDKTTRLVITKTQRQTLIDYINGHFPELTDGTPHDQWTVPAQTAQLYFTIFEGRKCADE